MQDALVCTLCGRDLERALANIPALEPELELTISRQCRFTATSDVKGGSEQPLPVHMNASERAGHLRAILVGWCRLCLEEAPQPIPGPTHPDCLHLSCSGIRQAATANVWPDNTLTAISRYLLTRVEWLRHHQAASDAVDEITEAARDCQRIIDAPANRTTFPVGPCPEHDEYGEHCPGEVRAYIPAAEGEPAHMDCSACKTRWETWQWERAGRRILQRRATLTLQAFDRMRGA